MNKAKNNLVKILALMTALLCLTALSACGGGGDEVTTTIHTHNYSKSNYNATDHWLECSCGFAKDIEKHTTDTSGICNICGFECNHTAETYPTCTTQAICSKCKNPFGSALGHSFEYYTSDNNADIGVNGTETAKCDRCEVTDTKVLEDSALVAAKGLEFALSSDKKSYIVTGAGTWSNAFLVIPATFNYLPVTGIGENAFKDCKNIEKVLFEANEEFKYIRDNAFNGCTDLTNIEIPESIISISYSAFSGCTHLKYNEYDNADYLGNKNNPYLVLIKSNNESATSYEINITTKIISSRAFWNCTALTTIIFPQGSTLQIISNNAFYSCVKLDGVKIPNNVTSIGDYAFYKCDRLTSVSIPSSVTSIGDDAFYECYRLEEVHISDIAAWCNINFGGYDSNPLFYANNLYLNGSLITALEIPDGVTKISYGAFLRLSSITSVSIPSSVTSIGSSAFYKCDGLTSVSIPSSVTSIGNYAFYNCDGLEEVHISDIAAWCNINFGDFGSNPLYYANNLYLNGSLITALKIPDGVTKISYGAFLRLSSITSVSIPSSVANIDNSAFSGCTGLASIVIPDSVTGIGDNAFGGCTGLKSITIPNNITSISHRAFYDCTGLESITVATGNTVYHSEGNCIIETETKTLIMGCKNSIIPTDSSITSIGDYAFYHCSGLTNIVIPDSVTSIGDCAFNGCSGLTSVTIGNRVTSIGSGAFFACSNLTSVTFKSTSGWFVSQSSTAAVGQSVDVRRAAANAKYLTSTYEDYYWKRSE